MSSSPVAISDTINPINPQNVDSKSIFMFVKVTDDTILELPAEDIALLRAKNNITKQDLDKLKKGFIYFGFEIDAKIAVDPNDDTHFEEKNDYDLLAQKFMKKKQKETPTKRFYGYTVKNVVKLSEPFKFSGRGHQGIQTMNNQDITQCFNDAGVGLDLMNKAMRVVVASIARSLVVGMLRGHKMVEYRSGRRPILDEQESVKYKYPNSD